MASALPEIEATIRLKELTAPVEIFRDAEGTAHVLAENEHDAFFGQGYVQAQDRLWQMECDRRLAAGRWAELVGSAGLPQDRQMRRFQITSGLEKDFKALAPDTQAMLEAFTQGVNGFIQSTQTWPIEFSLLKHRPEPWHPYDSIAVYKVRHIMMGVWESKLWRARLMAACGPETVARLHPGYPVGQLISSPPGDRFQGPALDGLLALEASLQHVTDLREVVDGGSNNWVVGGDRTASGKPLMAGDSHRAVEMPNVYYPNHLACTAFDVIGFSFPGVPGFPHFGHNAQVAWSITHGHADAQDLLMERFDSRRSDVDLPDHYQTAKGWQPVDHRRDTIQVKDGADEAIDLFRTHHGPIIGGDPSQGHGVAFCWSAQAWPDTTLDAVRLEMLAQNADALEAAQQGWVDPVQNLLYCDVEGAFGYRMRGVLPDREQANGWLPVPGWDGNHDWQGRVPFAASPISRNPAIGFAYSANNRIAGSEFPYYIALDFTPGFRAERIHTTLQGGHGMTGEDMMALHRDVVSLPAVAFRDLYSQISILEKTGMGEAAEALALLSAWDGSAEAEGPEPALFALFRHHLLRRVVVPMLGPSAETMIQAGGRGAAQHLSRLRARLHAWVAEDDQSWLPDGVTWSMAMGGALADAVAALNIQMARDLEGGDRGDGDSSPGDWRRIRWASFHRLYPRHNLSGLFPNLSRVLDAPSLPMIGDTDTVQAAGFNPAEGFAVDLASVNRFVMDAGDWERSGWVIPGGVSGHPGSPHYMDQLPVYGEHRLCPMRFGWERVKKDAKILQRLIPVTE